MKILIAEDDPTSAFLLERSLTKHGHQLVVTQNGEEALAKLRQESFDVVLTDWMMPQMDGITLIRNIREEIRPVPLILVVTSLSMPEAKAHAMDSGADDYITKPYMPRDVINAIENCRDRRLQPAASIAVVQTTVNTMSNHIVPPFPAVCLTANTGGPLALSKYFQAIQSLPQACFFTVLQAPPWALEMFAMRLQKQTAMRVLLAENGLGLQPGRVYLARKDRHMLIEPQTCKIRLQDTPPQNFCRPSADILFESVVDTFGEFTVSAALTGIGRDGVLGFSRLAAAGGILYAQDPATADAPYLPQSVSDLGLCKAVLPIDLLAESMTNDVAEMTARLSQKKSGSGLRA